MRSTNAIAAAVYGISAAAYSSGCLFGGIVTQEADSRKIYMRIRRGDPTIYMGQVEL